MLERMTLQWEVARSAPTNPLDERIDPYQSIGWTLRPGTGMGMLTMPNTSIGWTWCPSCGSISRPYGALDFCLNQTGAVEVTQYEQSITQT